MCLKAVGCQLGSVRALPFSQDTFLPALPAVLKQRAAKVLISGIDWGRAGHLRSDRGRYPRAEHNLGQGGHRGAGLYPLLLLPGGENSPQAKLCKHGKRGCESEHPHRQGELAETQPSPPLCQPPLPLRTNSRVGSRRSAGSPPFPSARDAEPAGCAAGSAETPRHRWVKNSKSTF